MAKPAPKTKLKLHLNLLFSQGTPEKLPIKFLRWLITYGRFLAIVVEVLVIATFVYRFKLDADLANINNSINQQVPYIQSLGPDEALIKQTQFKLTTISNNDATSGNWIQILQKISAQEPAGVKLNFLNLSHSSPNSPNLDFKLTGVAFTNTDLANFLNGLKQESSFKNISLTNITFDNGSIDFSITGSTK